MHTRARICAHGARAHTCNHTHANAHTQTPPIGGFFSGEITEVAGPCASGKTQVPIYFSHRPLPLSPPPNFPSIVILLVWSPSLLITSHTQTHTHTYPTSLPRSSLPHSRIPGCLLACLFRTMQDHVCVHSDQRHSAHT